MRIILHITTPSRCAPGRWLFRPWFHLWKARQRGTRTAYSIGLRVLGLSLHIEGYLR